jgi:hypothetical protein
MNWHEDKNLFLLSFFILIFAGLLLIVVWKRPDDGQTFTLFATTLSGFVGCLLGWLTKPDKIPPPGSTTITSAQQRIETPQQKDSGSI